MLDVMLTICHLLPPPSAGADHDLDEQRPPSCYKAIINILYFKYEVLLAFDNGSYT